MCKKLWGSLTIFVVNVQGICLILCCFVIVGRRCLQLVVEEYLSGLSGNDTEYESKFHIYFDRIVLSKNSEQSLRASTFVKSSVQLWSWEIKNCATLPLVFFIQMATSIPMCLLLSTTMFLLLVLVVGDVFVLALMWSTSQFLN